MGTNSILAASVIGAPHPVKGMGATILMHSDRHAATIVGVEHFRTGKRKGQVSKVWVQRDHAQRVDDRGMSDAQEYEYLPNAMAPWRCFTIRKNGRFVDAGGTTLAIGYRNEHYDFSY